MLTKIQARVIAFFSRPAVQSVVRHIVTAAVAAGVAYVAAHGFVGLGTGIGVVALLRAVWVAVRPVVVQDIPVVAPIVPEAQEAVQAPVVAS